MKSVCERLHKRLGISVGVLGGGLAVTSVGLGLVTALKTFPFLASGLEERLRRARTANANQQRISQESERSPQQDFLSDPDGVLIPALFQTTQDFDSAI